MQALKEKENFGKIEFRSQKEIIEERQRRRQESINDTHEKVRKILNGEIKLVK